ncbi:MAG: hypothetical protein KF744_13180 [Taibaiella sp.]|nr:hypothetical protein [Taibaiella sp.]
MKKIQFALNAIHFYFFVWFCYLHVGLNYFNPVVWILRLPVVEKYFKSKGMKNTSKKITVDMFQDRTRGFSIMWAGGYLTGLIGAILLSLLSIVGSLFGITIINRAEPTVLGLTLITASYAVGYFLVFRNEMYLEYFDKIERMPGKTKLAYGWFSFGFVLGVICLFLVSLRAQ